MKKIFLALIVVAFSVLAFANDFGDVIRLKNIQIDTSKSLDINFNAMANDLADESIVADRFLVQFTGKVTDSQKAVINKLGISTATYIPDNAFILKLNRQQIKQLALLAFIKWIGKYESSYKIKSGLAKTPLGPVFAASSASTTIVDINLFGGEDLNKFVAELESEGYQVLDFGSNKLSGYIRARVSNDKIQDIANKVEVEWIEPYVICELFNDVSSEERCMNVITVWETYGLDGTGQIIGHADSGLDVGDKSNIHPDFRGRIAFAEGLGRPGDWSDLHGHGTHTAGSIMGDGSASRGQFKGIAYNAQIAHQSIADAAGYLTGIPSDLNDLFQSCYDVGARIHSDSWGANLSGSYNNNARNVDQFMWNNPDMLVVFSAGNSGRDDNNDGVIDLDSMGAPGTAKNCLTVGASESFRKTGGISTYSWNSIWYYFATNPVKDDYISWPADDLNLGMAAFSSRGPCNDKRIKPDIVATGTDIISCRSQESAAGTGWGVYDDDYLYMGGTSMSTPLTAGAAALIRQYYIEECDHTTPSAALIKATLLNGARNIAPGQYGLGATQEIPFKIPNNVQGWGQVDLVNTLFPTNGNFLSWVDNQSVSTAERIIHNIEVGKDSTLKVVLAWSDYPGTLSANKLLVNDLDLIIVSPDGTTNTFDLDGSGRDDVNNVEGITIAAKAGLYSIEVVGYNVPQGPQPYALAISGISKEALPCNVSVQSIGNLPPISIVVSPHDNNDFYRGEIPVDLVYAKGKTVSITAPALVGANEFEYWQKDGSIDTTNNTISIVTAENMLLKAVYAEAPVSTISLLKNSGKIYWKNNAVFGVGDIMIKGEMEFHWENLKFLTTDSIENLFTINENLTIASGKRKSINFKGTVVKFSLVKNNQKTIMILKLKNKKLMIKVKCKNLPGLDNGLGIVNSSEAGAQKPFELKLNVNTSTGAINGMGSSMITYKTKPDVKSTFK